MLFMLTKDQIAQLSVEDQEMLAKMELGKGRQRQFLLEQARGLDRHSRYWPLYFFAVFIIFIAFYYFNFFHVQEKPAILYLFAGIGFVNGLIFHITRSNRRLDALVELLDEEGKLQNNDKQIQS